MKLLHIYFYLLNMFMSFVKNLVEELDRTVASFEQIKARNEELQQSEDSLKELCKEFEEENISLQDELEDSSYKYVTIT